MTMMIPLTQIDSPNHPTDWSRVDHYAKLMQQGAAIKPIKVRPLPGNRWIVADGGHRCRASKRMGAETIRAVEYNRFR